MMFNRNLSYKDKVRWFVATAIAGTLISLVSFGLLMSEVITPTHEATTVVFLIMVCCGFMISLSFLGVLDHCLDEWAARRRASIQ